jgi:hypothetical protein
MASYRKTIVFIISLIAYFIYLSISRIFMNGILASGNHTLMEAALYGSAAISILIVLYTQAAIKYRYASRFLQSAKVFAAVPLEKSRFLDRLLVYLLPSLSVIVPLMQTRSLSSVTPNSLIFIAAVILVVELLFLLHQNSMKAYITDKGMVIRGIDLRLEIPIPSNYRNPSGYFPFERIIVFLDLNDRLLVEQSYDLGTILLKGDPETLKQIKALFLANKVIQKKY